MTHDREQAHDTSIAATPTRDPGLEPGQASRSAALRKPESPMASGILRAFGLVQRKVSAGDNGVRPEAETAVATAAVSSGAPLPAPLGAAFGASLGADLSRVRVHTGSASQDAARAVGARAFTTGHDIHFAAGQYAPDTAAGKHLLAHEVAHTVQQSGGARTGPQYKLEVSAPGDGHELEADRAADAMVAGAAAVVTGAPASAARTVQRVITDSEMIRAQQKNDLQGFKPPTVLKGMTVTADISRCDDIIGKIDDARGGLGQLVNVETTMKDKHAEDGDKDYIPQTRGSRYTAINNATRAALDAMRVGAQKQQFDHSFFEPAYETLSRDFVKLQSAVHTIQASNINVAGAGDAVAKARVANPIVNTKLDNMGPAVAAMRTAAAAIPAAVTSAEATFRDVMRTIDMRHLPPQKLQDSAKQAEADAKMKAVNDDLEAAKGAIGKVQSTVTAAMSLYGGPEVMAQISGMVDKAKAGVGKVATEDDAEAIKKGAEAGADKGADTLKDKLAEAMTNYEARITRASGEAKALKDQISEIQATLDARELLDLQVTLAEKTSAVLAAIAAFEAKKAALDDLVKAIEVELKKMGGSAGKEVSAAIQLEADVARFDSQCDVAIALGDKEQTNAKETEAARKDAAGDYRPGAGASGFSGDTEIAATEGGRSYWSCEVSRAADGNNLEDLSGFKLEEHPVVFNVMASDKDQRSQVMSDAVQSRLDEVKKWKQEAADFRTKSEAVLNIQTG